MCVFVVGRLYVWFFPSTMCAAGNLSQSVRLGSLASFLVGENALSVVLDCP